MHHRQLTTVAGRVQGRGGLGQVFAKDRGVADPAVAEGQLVVDESDRPGFVSTLGSRESFTEERNSLGGLSASSGQPAVHPPEVGKTGRIDALSRLGWTPKRFDGLPQVVLKQPRLGQRAAKLNLLVARQAWTPQGTDEQRCCIRASPLTQGLKGLTVEVGGRHRGEYTSYTGAGGYEIRTSGTRGP